MKLNIEIEMYAGVICVNDAGLVPLAAGFRKLNLLSVHGLHLVTNRCVYVCV